MGMFGDAIGFFVEESLAQCVVEDLVLVWCDDSETAPGEASWWIPRLGLDIVLDNF